MHLSTSPCDFGHRLDRLVRSSLVWNDSEIHRVGGAGYVLLAERAGYVRVTAGKRSEPRPWRLFVCSRSFLLPGISPAEHTNSVSGDQLHGNALRRAASMLRQSHTIEPVDHARRDQGDSACFGTSVGPHHGYAFLRSRPQCRDCSGQFPSASLRTKHRPADLSFLSSA